MARQEISDEVWAVIEPLLPRVSGRSRAWLPHRQVAEGMLWRFRTGAPWRDVPEQFGPWNTGLVPLSPHSVRDISSRDVENRAMAPTQSRERPYRGAEWKD